MIEYTKDGRLRWFIGPSVPGPVEVWLSVDAQRFIIYQEGREGDTAAPALLVSGHVFQLSLRSQGREMERLFLDTRGAPPLMKGV